MVFHIYHIVFKIYLKPSGSICHPHSEASKYGFGTQPLCYLLLLLCFICCCTATHIITKGYKVYSIFSISSSSGVISNLILFSLKNLFIYLDIFLLHEHFQRIYFLYHFLMLLKHPLTRC